MIRRARHLLAFAGGLALLVSSAAHAQCTVTPYIVVDGQSCDWTTAEKPLTFANNDTTDPPGGLDIQQTLLTDNFSTASTGNGNLYGLMTFAAGTTFAANAQVGLFLNIAGGPPVDAACNANYAISFQCARTPCTTSGNWTSTFFTNLSGNVCQTAQTGQNLTLTGAGQQASFAINGTTLEFGVNFGAIGLPTTFLATPYSTTNLTTNSPLDVLAQMSYSATTIGPNATRVSGLAARSGPGGVTVGWLTDAEAGNLGFSVWRQRADTWTRVSAELIRGQSFSLAARAYQYLDPTGRPGDKYTVADTDRRTALPRRWGPVLAADGATLPQAKALPMRRAGAPPVSRPSGQSSGLRLGVTHEGVYRIDESMLTAAGLPTGSGQRLTFGGERVRLQRTAGGWLFYAPPVRNAYDGVDAYLLEPAPADGDDGVASVPAARGTFASTVLSHQHLKKYLAYDWYIGGDDPYIWAWATNLYPVDPAAFDAPAAAPGGRGHVSAQLLGGTTFDHHVQVQLNGTVLGEVRWTGMTGVRFEADLGPGLLVSSSNALTLVSIFDTGAPYEFAMLDSIELTYDRAPAAVGGEARFALESGRCVQVSGLGAGAAAWDVTDPRRARPLAADVENGAFTVCAQSDGARHQLELFDASAINAPTARPIASSDLRSARDGADEVIIVHSSLRAAAEPLATARRAQGLAVRVVDLTEVYDAFGYGNEGREPIRAFLRHAHQHWRRPLRYALLVGGANADLRDVLGTGVPNLIPTGVVVSGPDQMRAASDGWFATAPGAAAPFAAVGRLPADTVNEAAAVIQKVLAADSQGAATGTALLASDVSLQSDDANFAAASQVVGNQLKASGIGSQFVSAGDPAAAANVATALAQGTDLWHYVGHAGTSVWGEQQWLDASQVLALQNARLPLLTSYDCLDGMFDNPTTVTLGWAAVQSAQGGSFASFVPSTILSPREGHPFDLLVTQSLAAAPAGGRLGDALLQALQQAAAQPVLQDYIQTYNLLGDPASPNPLSAH